MPLTGVPLFVVAYGSALSVVSLKLWPAVQVGRVGHVDEVLSLRGRLNTLEGKGKHARLACAFVARVAGRVPHSRVVKQHRLEGLVLEAGEVGVAVPHGQRRGHRAGMAGSQRVRPRDLADGDVEADEVGNGVLKAEAALGRLRDPAPGPGNGT